MAKTRTLKKNVEAPSSLTMRLFDPGMSMIHRAGLGGLACTLAYIERAYKEGKLSDEQVPGAPWANGKSPWKIEPLMLSLDFGMPERAEEFLNRLFTMAFQIKGRFIYLPAQYNTEPDIVTLATLQMGLTLTFLQNGKVRSLDKSGTPLSYTVDEKLFTMESKSCKGFKHQEGWKEFCDNKSRLSENPIGIQGPLNPGAVVRHVAYTAQTGIVDDANRALPLYFAFIGCLALPINRGSGVLLIPEVKDLIHFARIRPFMTPQGPRDCQITSLGDAALQVQIRTRAQKEVANYNIPGFYCLCFQPTPWASQQKSRVDSMYVQGENDLRLEQFAVAMAELPPRIAIRKVKETIGRGKTKQTVEHEEHFWAKSVVRPLLADNLAQGRRWYEGFVELMRRVDPVSKKPIRDRVLFEKKGLKAMTEKIEWDEPGEGAVVRAVHESLRRRYGQIASESKGKGGAMKNRWSGEYDRWRLAFAGAKTPEQFRKALCDLFSRAGLNPVLQEEWKKLLPMLSNARWQLTRDLALLGLASYTGKGASEIEEVKAAETSEEDETTE